MSTENEYNFNTNQIGPRIPKGIKLNFRVIIISERTHR